MAKPRNLNKSFARFLNASCDLLHSFWDKCTTRDLDQTVGWPNDLDKKNGKSGEISIFTFLATFSFTQAVGLTVVLQKLESRANLLFLYYGIIAALTVASIYYVLRWTKQSGQRVRVRSFDETSIRFGRLVLAWVSLLSVVVLCLGLLRLLPFQTTPRELYTDEMIVTKAYYPQNAAAIAAAIVGRTKTPQIDLMNKWLSWYEDVGKYSTELANSGKQPNRKTIVILILHFLRTPIRSTASSG